MKLLYRFIHYFGVLNGVILFSKVISNSTKSLKLPTLASPIELRPGTTDLSIFYQVFFNQCYNIPFQFNPGVIVDAGANIGLSSVFFANKFPEAQIFALEPEHENFKLLEKNVAPYSKIIPLNTALWNEEGSLIVQDIGLGESGFVTQRDSNKGKVVNAVTIDSLMQKYQLDAVDILKIDVEGSEYEIFNDSKKWIDKIKCSIVETHDSFKPGSSKAVFKAFHNKDFELELFGENLVITRTDLV